MGGSSKDGHDCPCVRCVNGGEGCLFPSKRSVSREALCNVYGVTLVPSSEARCKKFSLLVALQQEPLAA
jgi:hypothetical protein